MGLLLVCLSVLVGARVLASADDTVAVLAAREQLAAGQPIGAGNLTEVRLRFTSDDDADRYLTAGQELPDDAVLLRPVGPGELVPRMALSTESGGLVELPLSVEPVRVPGSVRAGSVVDVWVSAASDGGTDQAAAGAARKGAAGKQAGTAQLLSEVPVLAVSRDTAGLGSGGLRQVVVGIASEDEATLRRVLSRLDGSLLVVRRPG